MSHVSQMAGNSRSNAALTSGSPATRSSSGLQSVASNRPLSENWELESLLPVPGSESFASQLERFESDLNRLVATSNELPAPSAATAVSQAWAAFLGEYERVETTAIDLAAGIGCYAAADAGNRVYRQYEAELSALDPLRETIATQVELALQPAGDADFKSFVASNPVLSKNEFFLRQRKKNASLRLPKGEELLAAELGVDGIHAWGRLYDRVSSELRIPVMEAGRIVEKSPGQIRYDSPERTVRENNFRSAEIAWKSIADTCADALNHIAGTRLTIVKRLGLTDHLDVPLAKNRMTRKTLETMWSVVTQRKGVLAKYLAAKARLLGLPALSWFDVTAPLPSVVTLPSGAASPIASSSGSSSGSGNSAGTTPTAAAGSGQPAAEKGIDYPAGCDLIERTFSRFSGDLGEFAKMSFVDKWIEAENRGGKRQGAFCTTFPGSRQSRIFMTFTNSYDDVSTLAHELGHAYHSWVLKDQPLFLQDYPMNLAETASTFAEAILAEERLKSAGSVTAELPILDHMLSDAVAFLMNIHARFLFEDAFYRERLDGELSAARLSELMLDAQKTAYCGTLADDGWYPDFWISKLHFYISGLPFYNFPYTFGYLLSTGLYAVAGSSNGSDFAARYRQLLIATGNAETEAAVSGTLGEDLGEPGFWQRSLDVVERRVNRFVSIVNGEL